MTAKRSLWAILAVVLLAMASGALYLTLRGVNGPKASAGSRSSVDTPTSVQSPVGTLPSSDLSTVISSPTITQSPSTSVKSPPSNAGGVSGQPANPSASSVTVHVTGATWSATSRTIEVGSSITGITAGTGNCTATASNTQQTVSTSGTAIFDGRGMSCGLMSIVIPAGWTGEVDVQVKFATTGASGVSEIVKVSVS